MALHRTKMKTRMAGSVLVTYTLKSREHNPAYPTFPSQIFKAVIGLKTARTNYLHGISGEIRYILSIYATNIDLIFIYLQIIKHCLI